MRKLILAIGLAVSLSISAQKVEVKKDNILVDGNAVAKIENKKGIIKVSDLSGKYLFSAERATSTLKDHKGDKAFWLRLTGANGNIREVEFTNTGFTLSNEKMITRNLAVDNTAFLTTSGINTTLVDEFFAKNDPAISNEIDEQYKVIDEVQNAEDAKAKEVGLGINDKGVISINGNKAGFIVLNIKNGAGPVDPSYFTFIVTDVNGNGIAKMTGDPLRGESVLKPKTLQVFDGKKLDIHAAYTSLPLSQNKLAERIVKALYANGYTFGDMKNAVEEGKAKLQQAAQDAYNQEYKKVESNSLNIVDADGYITDKAGNKINGLISIPFENIGEKMKPNGGISDITNFGGFVRVKDANGKEKGYKAKDGYTVFAGDRTFIPAKGTNDDALGSDSGSQIAMLGQYQYFEKDYENAAGYIVHHVKTPKYFYIKLKNSDAASYLGEKGMFKKKSAEKMEKAFNETLKCSAMKFSDYDTNSKEGMIKVLEDYAAKCK